MSSHDLFNRIEIKGLFGRQDETIEFMGDDSRVRILYGLNGSGKTTILRLIEAAIRWNPIVLWQTQFDSITFTRECSEEYFGENDEGEYLQWRSQIIEKYVIERTTNADKSIVLNVSCSVYDGLPLDAPEEHKINASKWGYTQLNNYSKVVHAPTEDQFDSETISEIQYLHRSMFKFVSKDNEKSYFISKVDGRKILFNEFTAKHLAPDFFPAGDEWSNRPDPTSRFLQLPLQRGGRMVIPKLFGGREEFSDRLLNVAATDSGFTLISEISEDFKSDYRYLPNLQRSGRGDDSGRFPVRYLRTDRMTSLLRDRSASENRATHSGYEDCQAIDRVNRTASKYIQEFLEEVKQVQPHLSRLNADLDEIEEDDIPLVDSLHGDPGYPNGYFFSRSVIELTAGLLNISPHIQGDAGLIGFSASIMRINNHIKQLSVQKGISIGPHLFGGAQGKKEAPDLFGTKPMLVDVAESFSAVDKSVDKSRTPTMIMVELNSKVKWLERLTRATKILSDKLGKKVQLSTSGITGYIIEDNDGNPLAPYQLSSGERQLFLIFAYLIDRVGFQKYSTRTPKLPPLVLIDEPEVSLHISWQRAFIDDLADVFNVEGEPSPQFIIATHSPSIVSTHMYRGHELNLNVEDLEM